MTNKKTTISVDKETFDSIEKLKESKWEPKCSVVKRLVDYFVRKGVLEPEIKKDNIKNKKAV